MYIMDHFIVLSKLSIFHDQKNNSYGYFFHDVWICVYFSFIYYCIANNLCAYFFCWFVWRKRQKNNHWSSFSYIWRSFFFFKPTFLLFNIFKKILFFILLLLDLVIYSVMPLFYANKRQDFSSFISIKRKIFFFFMPLQKSGF